MAKRRGRPKRAGRGRPPLNKSKEEVKDDEKEEGQSEVQEDLHEDTKDNVPEPEQGVANVSVATSSVEMKKPPPVKNARKSKSTGRVVAMRLSDKPEKLTKADLMCPICWSTLFKPITLPCNHSLCEQCFRTHVQDTSLNCPCCRLRLSVWCRKVMKEPSLLDVALWDRMKKEFPKLVEARTLGQDTQNIFDDCSQALFDRPDSPTHEESEEPRRNIDGVIISEPGTIRAELQQMMRQHQKDIEEERQRDERASASLIQQIQSEEGNLVEESKEKEDEDFLLAQRLQKEYEEEERQQRALRRQPKSVPSATKPQLPHRNLMKEWVSPYSPDITDLPRLPKAKVGNQSNKKSPRTSISKTASTRQGSKKKPTKSKPSPSPQSSQVSRASQDFMNKFLSPSPSTPPSTADPNTPCCSRSLAVHDVRNSAFSPTKPTSNMRLFVPTSSLAIPISSTTDVLAPFSSRSSDSLSKTPDSINSEIDRHFRPIRGAPKTPPRRRQDGKFLPEPKLVRTTPLKPTSSSTISAYICSPQKRNPDTGSRPSCATMEKRISNDSGRASDDSRSPETRPASSLNRANVGPNLSYQSKERLGCISEDYRVTPDEKPKTPEASKKRQYPDESSDFCLKKVKMEPTLLGDSDDSDHEGNDVSFSSPMKTEPTDLSSIKTEPKNPPLRFDITCTQGIITIDEDDEVYLEAENDALRQFREKAEQEAADRAFAEALQRDLNASERNPRSRVVTREKYSLRSWLNKPQMKQEVKTEARLAD